MSEEKLFELITKMYDEMQGGFKGVDKRLDSVEEEMQGAFNGVGKRLDSVEEEMQGGFNGVGKRLDSVEGRLAGVEERLDALGKNVAIIEIEHGQKLAALFDGYVQNSQKLDLIEAKVTKHEEFILKRPE